MHPEYIKVFKNMLYLGFPFTGFIIGSYLDDLETLRMTRFRDKSALYGRELCADDKPSWPKWEAF